MRWLPNNREAARVGAADALRPEYDFSAMKGAVRGKYVERYRAGVNIVLLEPGIAAAFPTGVAVNDALRAVLPASRC